MQFALQGTATIAPHATHLNPHTSPQTTYLTPHTSLLTPHTSHITPRTSPHIPHLTLLARLKPPIALHKHPHNLQEDPVSRPKRLMMTMTSEHSGWKKFDKRIRGQEAFSEIPSVGQGKQGNNRRIANC
jgi:hypothetical protein